MSQQKKKLKQRVIELLAEPSSGGQFAVVASQLGIDRRTLFRWRNSDPEFDAACREARVLTTQLVEAKLYGMALEGDMRAMTLFLKARKPAMYGTKRVEHSEPKQSLVKPGQSILDALREHITGNEQDPH